MPLLTPDATLFDDALAELESAEDFLEFFDVPYSPSIVQVNRLHILQRFHDYLAKGDAMSMSSDEAQRRGIYRCALSKAYGDFVQSGALGERVFRVLQQAVTGGSGCGSGACGSACGGARAV